MYTIFRVKFAAMIQDQYFNFLQFNIFVRKGILGWLIDILEPIMGNLINYSVGLKLISIFNCIKNQFVYEISVGDKVYVLHITNHPKLI